MYCLHFENICDAYIVWWANKVKISEEVSETPPYAPAILFSF